MKKLLFLLMALPLAVFGQTQEQNYVKTTVYRDENGGNPSSGITYFDGLGRPVQKIAGKQSPDEKDMVTKIVYDAYGRQHREYLPYVAPQDGLTFITGFELDMRNQYQTRYGDSIAYSEKLFEASPLNRVLKQAAPGTEWSMVNDHLIRFDYQTCDDNEVRWFHASGPTLTYIGYYKEGDLYKTITKNENWKPLDGNSNTTEEFKDKEGHIIMKRTYGSSRNIGGIPQDQWHETYYVYDDYDNLSFVLPPLVDTSATIDATILNSLCYQYIYDHRNRLIEKKLPGKQWEYIAYNTQDKPVASGPVLSPFGGTAEGWLITKYDIFGRVVYTGWLAGSNFQTQRTSIEANVGTSWAEHFTGSSTTNIDNFAVSYSNTVYPIDFTLLSINYYDGYNYAGATTPPSNISGVTVMANPKTLPTGNWVRVLENPSATIGELSYTYYDLKGRAINNRMENYMGGHTSIKTELDFAGKTLSTFTKHQLDSNGEIVAVLDEFKYTPEDRLLTHHQKINNLATEQIAENTYDLFGQLISKNVGGIGTPFQKVDLDYNIRGWLLSINNVENLSLPSEPKDLFAFRISYDLDINTSVSGVVPLYNGNIAQTDWRTSTDDVRRRYGYSYDSLNRLNNAVYQKPGGSMTVTNMYNESMSYDKNGNIQELLRNGDYDSNIYMANEIDELSYKYHPDKANQLMRVTDNNTSPKGFKDEVADNTANNTGTINDYGYDDNGNMTSDDNKDITSIVYNHLNLPTEINFGSGDKIEYLYDAAGQKLRKKVTIGTTVTDTDYVDGFQYTFGFLSFFAMAEGYVNVTHCSSCTTGVQNKYNYVYQYKDHLGNIRLSYSYDQGKQELKIMEENHYYPFGLKHTNYNVGEKKYEMSEEFPGIPEIKDVSYGASVLNKYKFVGQERQDELGLNWDSFRHRNYDYAIGRFMGIDPVSEEYMSISTYQFAHNNPVWKIELEGLEGAPSNGKTDITNHEPVKVENKPVLGFVGGGLVSTKVVQKTTKEVVKEAVKETAKGGVKVVGKVLGTVFAALTDYMSPNMGRTSERPDALKIDEKLSLRDHKVKEKTMEDTPIKRTQDKIDDLIDTSTPGKTTKGRTTQYEREGGADAANKEFNSLNPENVTEIEGGKVGTLPDGRTVIFREKSTDGRPTLEIQKGKNRTKFRYDE